MEFSLVWPGYSADVQLVSSLSEVNLS
jgi:hypothetical protein